MSREYTVGTVADCRDCGWSDEKAGATGRAAQHHDREGHEVVITTTLVYERRPDPRQMAIGSEPA